MKSDLLARIEKLEAAGERHDLRGLLAENMILTDFMAGVDLCVTTSGYGMGHLKSCVREAKFRLAELK